LFILQLISLSQSLTICKNAQGYSDACSFKADSIILCLIFSYLLQ